MSEEKRFVVYPVGTPGVAWGAEERKQWLARQSKKRDYFVEVVSPLMRVEGIDIVNYGVLDYRWAGAAAGGYFPLFAAKSRNWDASKPVVVVTGGVHGYETSGVQGALLFVRNSMVSMAASLNLNILVLPCVSPWGYEVIQRWTPNAVDPNRQFVRDEKGEAGCEEAHFAMKLISESLPKGADTDIMCHFDLHETTDSDNNEFRPSKIARDGETNPKWSGIPDGFFLVNNTHNANSEWQTAIMTKGVEPITHLAPCDENGEIIGEKMTDRGCITIDGRQWGICGAHLNAQFATTTEVYPDSPNATPEQCNRAQEAVVAVGIATAIEIRNKAKA